MLSKKERVEFIIEKQPEKKKKVKQQRSGWLKDLIDGSFLTRDEVIKQFPFVIFIAMLGLVYIGNRYHAEKVVKKTITIQKELKELRSEIITTASEFMKMSTQSVVAKKVEERGIGLKESTIPPKKIVVKEK